MDCTYLQNFGVFLYIEKNIVAFDLQKQHKLVAQAALGN